MNTVIEVVHSHEGGELICIVPLSNSRKKAKLLEKDYLELTSLGVGLPWKYFREQVWVRNGSNYLAVSRLILDADKGEVIRHFDDNPCNLIRSNLIRVPGRSNYKTRDMVQSSFRFNAPEIVHKQANTLGKPYQFTPMPFQRTA